MGNLVDKDVYQYLCINTFLVDLVVLMPGVGRVINIPKILLETGGSLGSPQFIIS